MLLDGQDKGENSKKSYENLRLLENNFLILCSKTQEHYKSQKNV